jgi:hypothetical protein
MWWLAGFRVLPVRKTGMETKKAAMAQIRVIAESFRNFLILLWLKEENVYRLAKVKIK